MFIKEGRFVFDVEPKTVPGNNGSFTAINTRMAFNTWARGKSQTLFADVSFVGGNAEWIVRNILKDGKTGKGMMVKVGGELYEDEYPGKDGEQRKVLRMDADFVKYAPLAMTNNGAGTTGTGTNASNASRSTGATSKTAASASNAQPAPDDNDPFNGDMLDFDKEFSDLVV